MSVRRKVGINSVGCAACGTRDIEVCDMHRDDVAARAGQLGLRIVPAVDEVSPRRAGIGARLA
jgi:hypothetical protein